MTTLNKLKAEILSLKEDYYRHRNPGDTTPLETLVSEEKLVGNKTFADLLGKPKGLADSTIQKIMAGSYPGDISKARETFQRAAASMRHRYQLGKFSIDGTLYDLPKWAMMKKALEQACQDAREGGTRKLIWDLDWPGFGKTTRAARIQREFPEAHGIIAHESWKTSYSAALDGVARGIGLTGKYGSGAIAENMLFSTLKGKRTGPDFSPPILCVDETEFIGPRGISLWKLLLNETPLVMVIACQPPFFENFRRLGGNHADQLMQRNRAVLNHEPVTAALASQFLQDYFPALAGDDLNLFSDLLTANANGILPQRKSQGGGLRFISEVCKALSRTMENAKKTVPNYAELTMEMGIYRASQNLPLILQ